MSRKRETVRAVQLRSDGRNTEILQIPRSDVTLAALDILLENPLRSMNGIQLRNKIQKRLRRQVNYAGVLKQVRSYTEKPYWNQVLVCEKKAMLCFYARKSLLSQKLHCEIHALYDLSHTLHEATQLKAELDSLKNKTLTDPFYDAQKIESETQRIEKRLNSLLD